MKKVYLGAILLLLLLMVALIWPIKKRREDINKLEAKVQILETKIAEEKEKNEKLKKEIEENSSEKSIEKISRNNLNMTKDGEKVYKFIESDDKGE